MQALQHSLEAIAEGTNPVDAAKIGTAPGDRITVPVLPTSAYEYLLLHGFSADVWMKPGATQEQVRTTAGLGALTPTEAGGVGLVLGAGNITGSAATHDVVVWGPGPQGAARREGGAPPFLQKPITSELGGVSPIIVVPGECSPADLRFQAEHVATQRLHNGCYNCIAGQVVLLSEDWSQREAFVEDRSAALASPLRRA